MERVTVKVEDCTERLPLSGAAAQADNSNLAQAASSGPAAGLNSAFAQQAAPDAAAQPASSTAAPSAGPVTLPEAPFHSAASPSSGSQPLAAQQGSSAADSGPAAQPAVPARTTVPVTYPGAPNASEALQLWEQHADNGMLWDVRLETPDGARVHANRLELCMRSRFFKNLFLGSSGEHGGAVLPLPGTSGSLVYNLVRSFYANEVTLDESNVEGMLELASRLQVEPVQQACCAFLLQQLPKGACHTYQLALKYVSGAGELAAACRAHLLANAERDLLPHIATLDEATMLGLLSSDQLVASELEVHKAAMAWWRDKIGNVGGHCTACGAQNCAQLAISATLMRLLTSVVRYQHMPPRELQQLLGSPLVRHSSSLLSTLADLITHRLGSLRAPGTTSAPSCWRPGSLPRCFEMAVPFHGPSVQSGVFRLAGCGYEWTLKVEPHSRKAADHVAVRIKAPNDEHTAQVAYSVQIIHLHHADQSIKKDGRQVFRRNRARGFHKFAARAMLESSGFLTADGTMIVRLDNIIEFQ